MIWVNKAATFRTSPTISCIFTLCISSSVGEYLDNRTIQEAETGTLPFYHTQPKVKLVRPKSEK